MSKKNTFNLHSANIIGLFWNDQQAVSVDVYGNIFVLDPENLTTIRETNIN